MSRTSRITADDHDRLAAELAALSTRTQMSLSTIGRVALVLHKAKAAR